MQNVKKLELIDLKLSNFRNYYNQFVEFSSAPVIITGANGSGKTNILEAISFLASGRGFRSIAKLDQANFCNGDDNWALNYTINGINGLSKLGTALDPIKNKRIIRIDGKNISSQSGLAKIFNVMWLIPQMDGIFIGSSTPRREFLDRMVENFYPEHLSHIHAYQYSMRERAKLLQLNKDPLWLTTLENKMAEKSIAIAAARIDTLNFIQHAIDSANTSFPKAKIHVSGYVEQLLTTYKAIDAEEVLQDQLKKTRVVDQLTKRTSIGIHKSDLEVIFPDKNMLAKLCSTGEQKALLISLVLAQLRAKIQWHGIIPILLLDEVVAHLDEERRDNLYQELLDLKAQIFMTGVEPELFASLTGNAQFIKLNNSKIIA